MINDRHEWWYDWSIVSGKITYPESYCINLSFAANTVLCSPQNLCSFCIKLPNDNWSNTTYTIYLQMYDSIRIIESYTMERGISAHLVHADQNAGPICKSHRVFLRRELLMYHKHSGCNWGEGKGIKPQRQRLRYDLWYDGSQPGLSHTDWVSDRWGAQPEKGWMQTQSWFSEEIN